MENTKIVVTSKPNPKLSTDILFYCITQTGKDKPEHKEFDFADFRKACQLGDFKGGLKESFVIYNESDTHASGKRVAFLGTGIQPKKCSKEYLREQMRLTGGNIAQLCKKFKCSKISVVLPRMSKSHEFDAAYCLAEGLFLGDYSFNKYKKEVEKSERHAGIKEIRFITKGNVKNIRQLIIQAFDTAISTCQARDMANEPGNVWTAESFAQYAKNISQQHNLKCKILNKREITKLGMGGILAVNSGSSSEPKLVVLEYHTGSDHDTLLLVGKGLTFDSGGISLKPASGMEDMKYDMCGGAAVLAAMNVIGKEKPKCNVVAIVPATDNMSGSSALKPGDIIYHYNKISSEIINTDAEGRLILADALSYGIEKYKPACVIDLATLTGAVIVGLGHHHSGYLSNNDKLAKKLEDAGKKSGEPVWRLPLGPHYAKQIESKVADIKNIGGRDAGTITAAEYLHKFVSETPWVHMDIAGTAWGFTEKSYIPNGGPSGVGVRTLVEFVRAWTNGEALKKKK